MSMGLHLAILFPVALFSFGLWLLTYRICKDLDRKFTEVDQRLSDLENWAWGEDAVSRPTAPPDIAPSKESRA